MSIQLKKIKITQVSGGAFHLPGNDIDTDRIIPARHLKCVTFEGLGDHVFEDDRKQANGLHPFDRPKNKRCKILLVDGNFASGSSREHAVPALTQWGIQAIIGLSFAAIFRGNAACNGLVCVTVEENDHDILAHEISNGACTVHVDLEKMIVMVESEDGTIWVPCTMPDSQRANFLSGNWDEIFTCLEAGKAIEETAARLPYFALPALVS